MLDLNKIVNNEIESILKRKKRCSKRVKRYIIKEK